MKYFVLTLCLVCQPCFAADWQSQAAGSKLSYSVNFEQQPVNGRFEQFQVYCRTTADMTLQELRVTVDLASTDMGGKDINEAIRQSDWFDVANHPQAIFTGSDFGKGQDERLIAIGTLQIKGVTKPIQLPLTWEPVAGQPDARSMTGQVVLNRLDFHIGTGEWASGDEIGLSVTVDFKITLISANKELEP